MKTCLCENGQLALIPFESHMRLSPARDVLQGRVNHISHRNNDTKIHNYNY